MYSFIRSIAVYIFFAGFCCVLPTRKCLTQVPDKPNFVFIVIDDLNDMIEGLTDQPQIKTPGLNAAAAAGTFYTNAYVSAPGCAPSRTSFFSGKDLQYTQVYNNNEYAGKFRENFTEAKGNAEVFTLPEILKDNGYFTFGINKLFHNPSENDFDKSIGTDMCSKSLSWNRMTQFADSDSLLLSLEKYTIPPFNDWGKIPDSLEIYLEDNLGADSAVQFLQDYSAGVTNTCANPFFLALGFYRPHTERYIPEKYYPVHIEEDIYAEPFTLPFNNPVGAYPYNGIVMPYQPDVPYADYFSLPGPIAQSMADFGGVYDKISGYVNALYPLPEIDPLLSDGNRKFLIAEYVKAEYDINYIAAVQFIDAQIKRVVDAVFADPVLSANTIIIITSDNGYSLGEKRHWTKWGLWDTDLRVPLIIIDPNRPGQQVADQVVSLLDLFPTVCDMAGVDYPVSANGGPYLDGHSFISTLDDPSIAYTQPVIAAYKKTTSVGSCFPHVSVRDSRFHYIRYRENNNGTAAVNFCDSAYVGFEEELYDVGVHRETDPYEWNNVAADPDYAPVIQYLQQWMPDSALYLQRAYTAHIHIDDPDCLIGYGDIIHGTVVLKNEEGEFVSPPEGYTYTWYMHMSGNVYNGTSADISTADIPQTVFENTDHLFLYFEMKDTATGVIMGFDMQKIYLNMKNAPVATFQVATYGDLSMSVEDYALSGTYSDTWWDFGDGNTSGDLIPGPYTYAAAGLYTVTNFVEYGNDSCVSVFSRMAAVQETDPADDATLIIYPKPASQTLHIAVDTEVDFAALSIYDIMGRRVYLDRYACTGCFFKVDVDVSGFRPGTYYVRLESDGLDIVSSMVVMH
ncbi:MAG: sulfatase-like hydrolase/transferase [Chitinophagales bacterium]